MSKQKIRAMDEEGYVYRPDKYALLQLTPSNQIVMVFHTTGKEIVGIDFGSLDELKQFIEYATKKAWQAEHGEL